MQIGTSLFLIAVGAILRYAVDDGVKDVDLSTVGLILMLVGIAGLVLTLVLTMLPERREARRTRIVERDVPPRY